MKEGEDKSENCESWKMSFICYDDSGEKEL